MPYIQSKQQLEDHNASLRIKVGDYIQNSLPIRLLQVASMQLVHRGELQGEINRRIGENHFVCKDDTCNCLEEIKGELRYSILSHRWSGNEVTFNHFQALHERVKNKSFFKFSGSMSRLEKLKVLREDPLLINSLSKLEEFLKKSEQRKCTYAWADTICINKESSAELDESIRSMFAWYQDSHVCIVYLSETTNCFDMERDPWFTRGWTLQELLAPRQLAFYSKKWRQITSKDSEKHPVGEGEKYIKKGNIGGGYGGKAGDNGGLTKKTQDDTGEESLWPTIAKITGIGIDDLLNFKPGLYDIGKRMTWASTRTTTRTEDMAYCLIGIFDINLSIAYGEKEKAFYRLQVEILQNSDDKTLFDWQGDASNYSSMLAASPACFSSRFDLHAVKSPMVGGDRALTLTSIGVRAPLVVHQMDRYAVPESWKLPGATAFSVLGTSTKGHHVIMILGQIEQAQPEYKRLGLVEDGLSNLSLDERAPEIVYIK